MLELINQIANIEISQKIMGQVDVADMANEFHQTFDRLDDFKKVRNDYNERGGLKKVWDAITFDDTLENAQLDAVEIQSRFNKVLGQLMILSVMQSQLLAQQQQVLSEQQGEIKKQTSDIIDHTARIDSLHEELANQPIKLKETLHKFIELKGFTEGEVIKIVAIADDVKAVRENLQRYFAEAVSEMGDKLNAKSNDLQKVEASLLKNDEAIHKSLITMLVQHKTEQVTNFKRFSRIFGLVSLILLAWISYLSLH